VPQADGRVGDDRNAAQSGAVAEGIIFRQIPVALSRLLFEEEKGRKKKGLIRMALWQNLSCIQRSVEDRRRAAICFVRFWPKQVDWDCGETFPGDMNLVWRDLSWFGSAKTWPGKVACLLHPPLASTHHHFLSFDAQ
jgi:hypothetical protein